MNAQGAPLIFGLAATLLFSFGRWRFPVIPHWVSNAGIAAGFASLGWAALIWSRVSVPWPLAILAIIALALGTALVTVLAERQAVLIPPPVSASDDAITIAEPSSGRPLWEDPQPHGRDQVSYRVRGKLKHLPEGYRVWLITEPSPSKFWPQASYHVMCSRNDGVWEGRVVGRPGQRLRVHAVVASPTGDQLFLNWDQACKRAQKWEPMDRIPEFDNRDYIETWFPPGTPAGRVQQPSPRPREFYEKWDHTDPLTLADAACLWNNEPPVPDGKELTGDALARYKMLLSALARNQIKLHDGPPAIAPGPLSRVMRSELKGLAETVGQRPPFLYPDAR